MGCPLIRVTHVTKYFLIARPAHSALMFAARITLAHLSVNSTMNLPKSVGVIGRALHAAEAGISGFGGRGPVMANRRRSAVR
jgi:hypothetical protein